MRAFYRVVLAAAALLVLVEAQKSKNGNDERPYEFGFTIPGEQHRQESKDTNGIIMGEFGFITADGIYHVTVFATDKDGNYKIISQKNIRVGPSPWGKKSDTPAPVPTTTTTTTPPPPPPPSKFSLDGKPGCSGCVVPTPPPPGSPPRPPLVAPGLGAKYPSPQGVGKYPASPVGQSPAGGISNRFPSAPANPGRPNGNPDGVYPARPAPFPGSRPPQQRPSGVPAPQQKPGGFPASYPQQVPSGIPATYPQRPGGVPGSQQQPGGAPSPQRRPEGALPDGVTVDDIMGLLYKFNYTAGFHGHHETGFRNGDKEGEFYTNFRDGLARKVTYVADKDGFRPKVTIVKVDDIDTPKAETEKEFGLKGYEFKWFNRRR